MRTYDDTFSGQKIYPGKVRLCLFSPLLSRSLSPNLRRLYHPLRSSVNDLTSKWEGNEELMANIFVYGKLYIRGDSKIFRFQNGNTESLFLQRKNPRRIAWTVLFRRQHRKGITEVSLNEMVSMR